MTRIGIMQGRLLPPAGEAIQAFPVEGWEREFELAAEAGLDAIEWIYDVPGEDANPIAGDEGLDHMRALAEETGVEVRSICADWFMEVPVVRVPEPERERWLERLDWLLGRASRLGIERVVLPFVDAARLASDEDRATAATWIEKALPAAGDAGIELHLETDLDPDGFSRFLEGLDSPLVKVNYDSGNSAGLGYSAAEELAAYGERVGSVHLKDRVEGGGTVPLGEGDADFEAVFTGLRKAGYEGDFVLQVARDEAGDEVEWARRNLAFLEPHLELAR